MSARFWIAGRTVCERLLAASALCLAADSAWGTPPGEVIDINWCSGSMSCISWSAASGSTQYRLYRGDAAGLPHLADSTTDSCLAGIFARLSSGETVQTSPSGGQMFWYLVTAANTSGEGSPGKRTTGPRILNPSGPCPGFCSAIGEMCLLPGDCCGGVCQGGVCQSACTTNGGACSSGAGCCSGNCVSNVCAATGTFPNADERLLLMAINRGRSDPATVKGPSSTVYPARPPIVWSYPLNRASRFHASNLEAARTTLMHNSPCTLNTNVAVTGCDGSLACACASSVPAMCANCANVGQFVCGTAPFTRIGYFTSGTSVTANAEVAAAGYPDTFSAVNAWLFEPAGADGHRRNLLDQGVTSNVMGGGHAASAGCFSTFDVVDQGVVSGLVIPKIPTGSIKPVRGNGGLTYRFYATWADASLGAPSSMVTVVDGVTYPMTLEIGSPTLNSTWFADIVLDASCHRYWFVGVGSSAIRFTYPTTGALEVPIGASVCPVTGP